MGLGYPLAETGVISPFRKGPGTRQLGKNLGLEYTPPPLTDKQSENITFPRTSYAGGRY